MQIKLNGLISISVEDEKLFRGESLPVSFVCDVEDESVVFADGKVMLNFNVPVQLCVSEDEWSRAVGEALAQALQQSPAA